MDQRQTRSAALLVRDDEPLVGIVIRQDGQDFVRYFVEDNERDEQSTPASIQTARGLLGAWKDIDADEALDELDRIRHESEPTPPIDL